MEPVGFEHTFEGVKAMGREPADWWATPGVAAPAATRDLAAELVVVWERFAVLQRELASAGGVAAQVPGSPVWADQLDALRLVIDRLEGVWLAAVGAHEAAGGVQAAGFRSLSGWLRSQFRMAPSDAAGRARVARALIETPWPSEGESELAESELAESELADEVGVEPPTPPRLTTGVVSGAVSWRHAEVIVRALERVPAEQASDAEAVLVEAAASVDPGQLRQVADRLLHALDADEAEQQAVARYERRGVSIAETFDGMVVLSGLLDPVSGATFRTALDALVGPTRRDEADRRSFAQRRADALTELCRGLLDSGAAGLSGGVRPHLNVIVPWATLHSTSPAGAAAEVAEIVGHGPITAEQARLIGCDATVSRVVTGPEGQILDYGRATRTIPPALRRAVTVRDRGCVAPGCHARPEWTDCHHIEHWEHGGATSLDNLVMLCRHHHTQVHQRGWEVVAGTGGHHTLRPPPRARPGPGHLRA